MKDERVEDSWWISTLEIQLNYDSITATKRWSTSKRLQIKAQGCVTDFIGLVECMKGIFEASNLKVHSVICVTVHGSVCSFCLCVVSADCLSELPSNPGADELIRVAAPDIHLGAYICRSVWGSCCQFVVTHALSCPCLSQALTAVPVSCWLKRTLSLGLEFPVVRRPGLLLLPDYLTCGCLLYPGSAIVAL